MVHIIYSTYGAYELLLGQDPYGFFHTIFTSISIIQPGKNTVLKQQESGRVKD